MSQGIRPWEESASRRLHGGLVALILVCAFSFAAIVKVALADDYHVTCVGHGFLAGSSQTDGSFFSRVEPGCGSTYRRCELYTWGSFDGSVEVFDSGSLCSAWSREFGTFTECASTAHVYDQGVFSDHIHLAPNWCG
jgi:hypothetical protein